MRPAILRSVNLLFLGSSNDVGQWFEAGAKRHEILRERLEAEFGEPVEVIVKSIWPDERMVSVIGHWLDETETDAIYLNVTSYPFVYESLPLRLRRVLGPLGPAVGDAGLRFADSKRWAHNAVFRTVRRWGQATIGGDTHFTCDEVIERFSEVIRLIARREGACLIVKGPKGAVQTGITLREQRRKEAKRLYVHHALQGLCERLHIDYIGRETPLWRARLSRGVTAGDGLHANAAGHADLADGVFKSVRAAWARHLVE
jgi:hypothetical protein